MAHVLFGRGPCTIYYLIKPRIAVLMFSGSVFDVLGVHVGSSLCLAHLWGFARRVWNLDPHTVGPMSAIFRLIALTVSKVD